MSEVDSVIIDIQNKLACLPPIPSKPSIFKVRNGGYDPKIVSIGPYHHGISRLQNMEQLKYMYLKRLLERKNEQNLDLYTTAVAAMEKRARTCYAESLDHFDEEFFMTLILVDGIFLIELFRYSGFENLGESDDPIFRHEQILSQVRHDILLLENQLPFFVLNELFNMTKTSEDPDDELITLALRFFDGKLVEKLPVKNVVHICGLIHDVWCQPFAQTISISKGYISKSNEKYINSISSLREAGIKFKKEKGNNNLMDIKFENGVLKIPECLIFNETESQFRNLIAYEQYLPNWERRYVSDYTVLMHCFINTVKDVEILRDHGIIETSLRDDKEICLMFNRLGRNIVTSSNFCYSQLFYNVKRWKANLRRNYFNSPWSIIKFLAAVVLLVLAFTQTTFIVLKYYNRMK